ncbi:hypothetical protein DFP72DRAFT_1179888 [Ephemerocybe angulata]|uniref:Uncharacterized protein n=1 Tax=Ephemerocybe angulata TaxID=980116 RepID=A0A8H6LTC0_9AGAR|nr:hypothetical protein DFP72DRAFT_1179888 [Tulosesus angulatus]
MNPNNSSSVPPNRGRGFGEKIRGVYEVIHGIGENIRGSFLGALDTMSHHDSTVPSRNDQIAAEGRAELQRGLTHLGRRPAGATGTTTSEGYNPYFGDAAYYHSQTGPSADAQPAQFGQTERTYHEPPAGAPPLPARKHDPANILGEQNTGVRHTGPLPGQNVSEGYGAGYGYPADDKSRPL